MDAACQRPDSVQDVWTPRLHGGRIDRHLGSVEDGWTSRLCGRHKEAQAPWRAYGHPGSVEDILHGGLRMPKLCGGCTPWRTYERPGSVEDVLHGGRTDAQALWRTYCMEDVWTPRLCGGRTPWRTYGRPGSVEDPSKFTMVFTSVKLKIF